MQLDILAAGPFTYAEALAAGITRAQLRTAVRQGSVVRLAWGLYAREGPTIEPGERWETTEEDHLRRLREALRVHPGCAASHDSAALLHGLPLVLSPTAEVQLVRIEDYPSSRHLPGLKIHHADSTATETVTVTGLRATTIPRTIADVLRTHRVPHALGVLDQSLRRQLATLSDVRRELDAQRHWVGKVRAEQTMELVDPLRESWAESFSFGTLAVAEFPPPIPQVEILDASFNFLGRVDGLLDHENAFFEVHGKQKYFMGFPGEEPEETVRRRLIEESRRHLSIEHAGLPGAQWTADEAMHNPDVVVARMHDAIRRGRDRTFTGWARWQGRLCKLPLVPR